MAFIRVSANTYAIQTVGRGTAGWAQNTAGAILGQRLGPFHDPGLHYQQLPVAEIPHPAQWSKAEEVAGDPVLAVDDVSWSWTADAVALEYGRELVPDSVAWTWTASAVTMVHGYPLAAASVSWTWSATDAALEYGREVAADNVAWSWTVTAAALERGFELVPDSVAWSWSAADVTLIHAAGNPFLVADSVAWSWSATDASLERGFKLAADDVAWSWSAGDVTLTVAGVAAPAVEAFSGGWKRRRRKRETLPDLSEPPPTVLAPEYAPLKGEYRPYKPAPIGRSPELEKIARDGLAQIREIENLSRTQRARLRAEQRRRLREDEEWLLLD